MSHFKSCNKTEIIQKKNLLSFCVKIKCYVNPASFRALKCSYSNRANDWCSRRNKTNAMHCMHNALCIALVTYSVPPIFQMTHLAHEIFFFWTVENHRSFELSKSICGINPLSFANSNLDYYSKEKMFLCH